MSQSTESYLSELLNVDCVSRLDGYIDRLKTYEITEFSSYIKDYLERNSISLSSLQKKSYIERSYFYQIVRGCKNPGRDKVVSIALAAGMTLQDAQLALQKAGGWSLCCVDPRDCVLIYAVNKSLSIAETNSLLEHYGEGRLE
jgi:hypothetical protein